MTEQPQQPTGEQPAAPEQPETSQPEQQPVELPEGAVWQKDANKTIGSRVKEDRDRRAQDAGFDSWESMTAAATSQKERDEANKSELDKYKESYGTVETERDSLQETLADMQIEREMERRLLTEGVPADGMERVMRLAETGEVSFDDNGKPDSEALDSAITAVKETYPELFGGTETAPRRAPDLSGSGGGGNGQPQSEDQFNQRLRQRGLGGG